MVVTRETSPDEVGEDAPFEGSAIISSTPLKPSRTRRDLPRKSLLQPIEDQFDESEISIEPKPARQTPTPSATSPVRQTPHTIRKASRTPSVPPGLPPTLTHPPTAQKRQRSPSRSNSPVVAMAKPRLVISKLVLINFKSYAGRQEIGPFDSSFSAIVGPNGSGKSNVIDSLLFVFGFRASKMRHSKISALIHNSKNAEGITSCSVEVHFRDVLDTPDGETEPVPGSELVVARSCNTDNNSKYTINGKNSSHTEVTQLLRMRGIDIDHKRFLILQGEIESIAQMKAKADKDSEDGLLEYLEDIIGTAKYKQPLAETHERMEELNEVCLVKNERLMYVQKEVDALTDRKNEVLSALKTENDLIRAKSAYHQVAVYQSSSQIELASNKCSELQRSLDEEVAKTNANNDEIKQLTKEQSSMQNEITKKRAKHDELSKALSKKEIEKVKIEEKVKHLETKSKKVLKLLEASKKAKAQAEAWIQTHDSDSAEHEATQTELEKELGSELKAMESIQETLRSKTQQYTDEIEQIQRELSPWKSKLATKESEISVANSELELLKEQSSSAERAVKEAQAYGQSVMEQGQQKEQELFSIQNELENIGGQIERGTVKCQQSEAELEDLRAELNVVRDKVDLARDRASQTQSQNRVLAGLSRLSKSGRLKGFRGRLGDLGYIAPKYDVAVSTACGALDNIVVDTVECAQECIEYLRKNNLGRGRFICLNQQQKRDFRSIKTPDNVPRLFDLITPIDERYQQAFYNAIMDTLVANDIDHARSIAYGGRQRWRVVTLGGALVESSGAMSGGGQVSRGKMCLGKEMAAAHENQMTDEELQEMNNELRAAEDKFNERQKLHDHMIGALISLKEKKPQLEMQVSKLELEITALEKSVQEAKRRFKETQQEAKLKKPDLKALEAKESVVKKLESEREKLKAEVDRFNIKIEDLQGQIIQAGGLQLRMQKSKVDGLRERIANITERLSRGISERAKQENLVKREDKKGLQFEQELEQMKEQIDEAQEELGSFKGIFSELQTQVNTLGNEMEDEQEKLDGISTKLTEKQEEIDSLRSREIELKTSLDELQKGIADQERRRDKHLALQEQLVLNDLTEFDCLDNAAPALAEKQTSDAEANAEHEKGIKSNGDASQDQSDVDDDEENPDRMDVDLENETSDKENTPQQGTQIKGKEHEQGMSLYQLPEYTPDELQFMRLSELKENIADFEAKLKDVRIDMAVLNDYKRRVEDYNKHRDVVKDAVSERDIIKQRYNDLAGQRLSEFMTGFNTISAKLKEMYQMITMGGNAELELVDTLDPFSEGILFSVMPPKKSWRNISNLSGGEKTLSSLALVFALHTYKPTPLYVMDEIDAALDFRNVSIVASYIKDRTKNGQFIVISLRNNMFELARQLVGIYKVNDKTRSIPLINDDIVHK